MQFVKKSRTAFLNFIRSKYSRLNGEIITNVLPYHILIDPSSCCQLRCSMCLDPKDPNRRIRHSTLMSPELYASLLDELGEYLFMISLYNWGEPLLNPHLSDFIKRAKQQDIYVDINTNLALELTDADLITLLQSGVDNIVVSIDGFSQATYGQYRIGGSFELARRNITRLTLLRDKLALTTTITWKFLVFSFNEHEIALAEQYCQNFGITFARKESIIDLELHPEWLPSYRQDDLKRPYGGWPFTRSTAAELKAAGRETTCAWHYCYSSVNADGSVSPCCAVTDAKDDFGTVIPGKRTFADVWNGDLFRKSRAHMAGREVSETGNANPICSHCPYPFLKDLSTGIDQFITTRFRELYGKSEPALAGAFDCLAAGKGFKEYVEANPAILGELPPVVGQVSSVAGESKAVPTSSEKGTAPAGTIVCGRGTCTVCGADSEFFLKKAGFSLRETVCSACGASRRTRDLAAGIMATYGLDSSGSLNNQLSGLSHLQIFEAQADGPLHRVLQRLPGYRCAEFFDGIPLGATNTAGVRCEDLERLTFADDSFDLVITQDVFEHVANPLTAFREIARVLKAGGCHIFTVPLHEGHKTVTRVELKNGQPVHLLPPVYHGDPLRAAGSLVYTDFGSDLPDLLVPLGFETDIIFKKAFYAPGELPWIDNAKAHAYYLQCRQSGELLTCLRYNSVVFSSSKNSPLKGDSYSQPLNECLKKAQSSSSKTNETIGSYWDNVSYASNKKTRWWQSAAIIRHINFRVCGKAVEGFSQGLIETIKDRNPGTVYSIGIAVGCGSGQKEMNLIRQGIVGKFFLYDFSQQRVQQGKELAEKYGISDRIEFLDEDPLKTFPSSSVDFVHWNNALHHMMNTEEAVYSSRRVLRTGGAFVMDDFIGPNRFQWSQAALDIASWVRSQLPPRYLRHPVSEQAAISAVIMRPELNEMIRIDPSEAADSENIIPAIQKYFPKADVCMTGGAMYALALNDVLANIDEENDQEMLEMLLKLDDLCSHLGINHYATAFSIV